MALPALIIPALTWLGRIGMAAFAVNEIKDFVTDEKETFEAVDTKLKEGGATDEEIKMTQAALVYEKVEELGQNPDEFWEGLTLSEREELQFNPKEVRRAMNRTEFLGMSAALLFTASFAAAMWAKFRGIPIGVRTLANIAKARKEGKGALDLFVILQEGAVAGLEKVWFPAALSSLLAAGGWLTQGLRQDLNDVTWYKKFLQQEEQNFAATQNLITTGFAGGGGGGGGTPTSRTRITMSKKGTPTVAVGTLFQARLKDTDAFKRVVDDEITSPDDLKTDVMLNLNNWLATLPGRLHYEIRIVLNPLDNDGNKRQGTWAMLMIGHRNSQGVYQHMQAIPLGPIEPTIYTPTKDEINSIQIDIPEALTGEEIMQLDLPTKGFTITDEQGYRIPISFDGAGPQGTADVNNYARDWNMLGNRWDVFDKADNPVNLQTLNSLKLRVEDIPIRSDKPKNDGKEDMEKKETIIPSGFVPKRFGETPVSWDDSRVIEGTTYYLNPVYNPKEAEPAPEPKDEGAQSALPEIPDNAATQRYPYVRYLGSPNVFNRNTGKHITHEEAEAKDIFAKGLVQQFQTPRPEVKVARDFEVWHDKNLTTFPV